MKRSPPSQPQNMQTQTQSKPLVSGPVGFRARTGNSSNATGAPSPNANKSKLTTEKPDNSGSSEIKLPEAAKDKAPGQSSTPAATPAPRARSAPPMQKRPKGRLFLTLLFLGMFTLIGYSVFSTFFQVQSYGIIEGRLIAVSAPWDGTVSHWMVRDGDVITQGQIIARLTNLEMEHDLASKGDELKLTQAQLESEMSKIQFNVRGFNERTKKAAAEYLQASGELAAENSRLDEYLQDVRRAKRLIKSNNISRSAYEKTLYQYVGQQRKVTKLEQAVEVLKTRSDMAEEEVENGSPQLKPLLARIEKIQSEITRLRQLIDLGHLRAPCSGRITKRHSLTGESSLLGETVVEILEDNSIEAVLYVPQGYTDRYEVGNEVEIHLEPYDKPMVCVVDRFGERYESAPESIMRFYSHKQYLLPIYLKPLPEYKQWMAIRVHGTVKRNFNFLGGMSELWSQGSDFVSNAVSSESETVDPLSSVPSETILDPYVQDFESPKHQSVIENKMDQDPLSPSEFLSPAGEGPWQDIESFHHDFVATESEPMDVQVNEDTETEPAILIESASPFSLSPETLPSRPSLNQNGNSRVHHQEGT